MRAQLDEGDIRLRGRNRPSSGAIDIIGVSRSRRDEQYFSEDNARRKNHRAARRAFNFMPGLRLSNIQRVPIDSFCALTVTATAKGRDGVDDSV